MKPNRSAARAQRRSTTTKPNERHEDDAGAIRRDSGSVLRAVQSAEAATGTEAHLFEISRELSNLMQVKRPAQTAARASLVSTGTTRSQGSRDGAGWRRAV